VLARLLPGIHALNGAILEPLNPDERVQFLQLLRKFVRLNNAQSRAPLQETEPS
jgi:hypothetical protein